MHEVKSRTANKTKNKRDITIDTLRFLGLSLIILAHVNPPMWLSQVRSFDVPLMIIVSALSYQLSYKKIPYFVYFKGRVKRLLLPVWFFLTFLFLAIFVLRPQELSSTLIIDSYLLLDGIGYVWIIRIFLLVAVVAPFINFFNVVTKRDKTYLTSLLIVYAFYEGLLFITLTSYENTAIGKYIGSIVLYIIPYALLFAYGLRFSVLSKKTHYLSALLNLIIFSCMACYLFISEGRLIPTSEFKYPPSIYYICFALLGCECAWLTRERLVAAVTRSNIINKTVSFISQNSLWIYLWHIPIILLSNSPIFFELHFLARYFIAYVFAVTVTMVQVYIVNRWILRYIQTETLRKNFKILFLS